ncbi:MAG: nitrous oxide reductase accessory protein NosL [Thermomicrobiales bacterium]|nr:nitrous oxide reductase accessory protein NosL [Thermomicrobiales bacterium]
MNRFRWPGLAVAMMLTLVIAACGGDKAVSLDPPTVKYNEDISEMGMFVVDPRYTAAWLPEEGEWILFDDIGEMLKYRVDRFPDAKPRVIWVNDYLDSKWVKADEAWYVQTKAVNTPMGWGIIAFRNEADAQAFIAENGGELLTWELARARHWDAPPAPVGTGHDHGGTPDPDASPQP